MDRKVIVAAVALVMAVGSAVIIGSQGCGASTGTVVRQEARNALDCIPPAIAQLSRCQAEQRQGCAAEAFLAGVACVLTHPPQTPPIPPTLPPATPPPVDAPPPPAGVHSSITHSAPIFYALYTKGNVMPEATCQIKSLTEAPGVAGWSVIGVAQLVVPHGEIRALVVGDASGARRAVYWDRATRTMVAPMVDDTGAPTSGGPEL